IRPGPWSKRPGGTWAYRTSGQTPCRIVCLRRRSQRGVSPVPLRSNKVKISTASMLHRTVRVPGWVATATPRRASQQRECSGHRLWRRAQVLPLSASDTPLSAPGETAERRLCGAGAVPPSSRSAAGHRACRLEERRRRREQASGAVLQRLRRGPAHQSQEHVTDLNRDSSFTATRQDSKAIHEHEEALRLDPKYARVMSNLSWWASRAGSAIRVLLGIDALASQHQFPWRHPLALACEVMGDPDSLVDCALGCAERPAL